MGTKRSSMRWELGVMEALVHLGDVARHDNFMFDYLLHGLK